MPFCLLSSFFTPPFHCHAAFLPPCFSAAFADAAGQRAQPFDFLPPPIFATASMMRRRRLPFILRAIHDAAAFAAALSRFDIIVFRPNH